MSTAAPPEIISEETGVPKKEPEVPKRFQPSKTVLLIDRWMTQFIKVGGVSIIAAVLGIFVFIFVQIFPLFGGAKVKCSKEDRFAEERLPGTWD